MRVCTWLKDNDLMRKYHDEWWVPRYDDRYIFKILSLEGAQA